eukprot:354917-Chlamydomonas_euryale.AAC.9
MRLLSAITAASAIATSEPVRRAAACNRSSRSCSAALHASSCATRPFKSSSRANIAASAGAAAAAASNAAWAGGADGAVAAAAPPAVTCCDA